MTIKALSNLTNSRAVADNVDVALMVSELCALQDKPPPLPVFSGHDGFHAASTLGQPAL